MLIAVLSDFHLGTKNKLDRFGRANGAEAELIALFEQLERTVDRIVLLGDIFETLRGPIPGRPRHELQLAMAAYPGVTKRILEDPRYHLVQGNHDVILARACGASEFFELAAGRTKIAFFHGHQLTWLERGRARLSQTGVWLGGMVERFGVPITAITDRRLKENGAFDDFINSALSMGRVMGADVVVTGHTHSACKREVGDQLYLNSGTCVAGRREYLLIDTESHSYRVIKKPATEDRIA